MSIYFSGTFKRSSGVISAIQKHLKLVNLKPVKKIQVQFDPFHPNANIARDFLFYISTRQVANTNVNCIIKTNIVCDRTEPQIKINLADSSSVNFEASNLTVLEILQQFNKHISSTVKIEEPTNISIKDKLKSKKTKKK